MLQNKGVRDLDLSPVKKHADVNFRVRDEATRMVIEPGSGIAEDGL